jgi:tetratricopeptide (TPR) repeat protein
MDESVEPLDEAERVAVALGDEGAVQFIENARGQFAMARGEYDEAERHLRTAVSASSRGRARVTIRLNLAETLLATGRRLDAAEEARRAEQEAIETAVADRLPEVYRLLGRIAALEGNADAFVLFERALQMIDEAGLPRVERARTLQSYAEAERHLGDPENADRLQSEADQTYDALGIRFPRRAWADLHGPDEEAETHEDR